jgi:hypothetical protein
MKKTSKGDYDALLRFADDGGAVADMEDYEIDENNNADKLIDERENANS